LEDRHDSAVNHLAQSLFPQITDIIGAMVIVWRARGKLIRSLLCSIMCNNCSQCSAHTNRPKL